MSAPRVIAIDGPAGSGKSTLSRSLARRLDLAYLNTGIMYRALTARAVEAGTDTADPGSLLSILDRIRFEMGGIDPQELLVDGARPGSELEATQVERAVSAVSRHPQVRGWMRRRQRELGERGAVVEGRDIATVVFPDAAVKIFLEADASQRVARRTGERATANAGAALHERDARDAEVNPFEPTADSSVIDTTALSKEGTLERALAIVHQVAPGLVP
jgi:cytidylate kinase